jgi:hypothetical protein
MNFTFRALSREAGLAAEHIASGVTALGKGNYAQPAYYAEAFFALSIGFERSAKLAIVVDHAMNHNGEFPSGHEIRQYGHNLRDLLAVTDRISRRLAQTATPSNCLPSTAIHKAIIDILNDFATNVTRYYNLDVITWGAKVHQSDDPVKAWYERVTLPILDQHWRGASRSRAERDASIIASRLGEYAIVSHQSESREPLDNIYAASFETGRAKAVAPYTRMYVLQIARFFCHLMSDLTFASHKSLSENVPYLSEFFAIFNNDDAYFKRRRNWSIYKP